MKILSVFWRIEYGHGLVPCPVVGLLQSADGMLWEVLHIHMAGTAYLLSTQDHSNHYLCTGQETVGGYYLLKVVCTA